MLPKTPLEEFEDGYFNGRISSPKHQCKDEARLIQVVQVFPDGDRIIAQDRDFTQVKKNNHIYSTDLISQHQHLSNEEDENISDIKPTKFASLPYHVPENDQQSWRKRQAEIIRNIAINGLLPNKPLTEFKRSFINRNGRLSQKQEDVFRIWNQVKETYDEEEIGQYVKRVQKKLSQESDETKYSTWQDGMKQLLRTFCTENALLSLQYFFGYGDYEAAIKVMFICSKRVCNYKKIMKKLQKQ